MFYILLIVFISMSLPVKCSRFTTEQDSTQLTPNPLDFSDLKEAIDEFYTKTENLNKNYKRDVDILSSNKFSESDKEEIRKELNELFIPLFIDGIDEHKKSTPQGVAPVTIPSLKVTKMSESYNKGENDISSSLNDDSTTKPSFMITRINNQNKQVNNKNITNNKSVNEEEILKGGRSKRSEPSNSPKGKSDPAEEAKDDFLSKYLNETEESMGETESAEHDKKAESKAEPSPIISLLRLLMMKDALYRGLSASSNGVLGALNFVKTFAGFR